MVCSECSIALGCSRRRQIVSHDSVVAGSFPISPNHARCRSPDGRPRRRDDGLGVVEGRDAKHRDSFSRTVRRMDPQPRFLPRWGGYISARVQERILNIAVAHDARVSALESVFVLVTLGECDQTREPVATVPRPVTPHTSGSFSDSCWEMIDRVNLQEVFESRFKVLQNCPHSVRGRFRQAVRTALEARSEAVRSQDVIGEGRGWKLFCLPILVAQAQSRQPSSLQVGAVREDGHVQPRRLGRVDA